MATNGAATPTPKGTAMIAKLTALCLALFVGALAAVPASASTDDPSSPFYLLPTKAHGTTLQAEGSRQ